MKPRLRFPAPLDPMRMMDASGENSRTAASSTFGGGLRVMTAVAFGVCCMVWVFVAILLTSGCLREDKTQIRMRSDLWLRAAPSIVEDVSAKMEGRGREVLGGQLDVESTSSSSPD